MKTETMEQRAAAKAWEPYTITPKDSTECIALAIIKTFQLCRDNEPIDKLLDSISLDAENKQAVRFAYAAWWNDYVTRNRHSTITEKDIVDYFKMQENYRRGTDNPEDFSYGTSEVQDYLDMLL